MMSGNKILLPARPVKEKAPEFAVPGSKEESATTNS
jgi:hypothetical protein